MLLQQQLLLDICICLVGLLCCIQRLCAQARVQTKTYYHCHKQQAAVLWHLAASNAVSWMTRTLSVVCKQQL
jgi:hypothetical protein